jgi:hypothetical protein
VPPPNPTIGKVIKVTTVARINGQSGEMTSAVQVSTIVGSGVSLTVIAGKFLANYQTAIANMNATQVVLNGVVCELLNSVTGRVSQSVILTDNVTTGLVAGDTAPTQVAVIVRKVTGFAGRSERGRLFVPFVPDDKLNANGELIPPFGAVCAGLCNIIFGPDSITVGPDTTSWIPVLLHKTPPLTPISFTLIDSFSGTERLGTQRRRGDYGKLNAPLA